MRFDLGCLFMLLTGSTGCTAIQSCSLIAEVKDHFLHHDAAIVEAFTVPLAEVSGLSADCQGWTKVGVGATDSTQITNLVAVGDRAFAVAIIDLESFVATHGRDGMQLLSLQGGPVDLPAEKEEVAPQSQFEGVTCNPNGELELLVEERGELWSYDRDGHFKGSRVFKGGPADGLHRFEGVAHLQTGEMVLVREKKPLRLVRLNSASNQIDKIWEPGRWVKWVTDDLSEITRGPAGRWFVLSDEDRVIARIKGSLDSTTTKFHYDCVWQLPAALANPEGLVIHERLNQLEAWVASDNGAENGSATGVNLAQKKLQPNLWRLQLATCPTDK